MKDMGLCPVSHGRTPPLERRKRGLDHKKKGLGSLGWHYGCVLFGYMESFCAADQSSGPTRSLRRKYYRALFRNPAREHKLI